MDRRLDYASALWTRKAIRLSKTAELVRPVSSRLLWTSSLKSGGADRDRTDDLRLAKPALSQLSYRPAGGRAIARTDRPGLQKLK